MGHDLFVAGVRLLMLAARFHAYGPVADVAVEDVPIPAPGPGELLVKVAGVGLNPYDVKLIKGVYKDPRIAFPKIVGHDVSGVVERLGADVEGLAVGDRVYGESLAFGSAAEYSLVEREALDKAPVSMDLADASALPIVGMTAWQALFEAADLQPGQRVLVHAAGGGVGHIAVQLAKWRGATVYGTASADKLHFIAELGVDEPIDYAAVAFETVVRDADVVFDTVGGQTQRRSRACLKPGGVLVSIAEPPDAAEFAAEGKRALHVSMKPSPDKLRRLAALVEDLKLRVVIDVELPLRRIGEALAAVESGHSRGKVVVHVP